VSESLSTIISTPRQRTRLHSLLTWVLLIFVTCFLLLISIKTVSSAEVVECDRLAAIPGDPNIEVTGVDILKIQHDQAISACERAYQKHPEQPRYAFQLARALLAARRPAEARISAQLAIDAGYRIASVILGYLATSGQDQEKNEAEATEHYRMAAEAGLPMAAFVMAVRYAQGIGVQGDAGKTIKWIKIAAEGGNAEAIYELGRIYLYGENIEKDFVKARALFEQAANLGVAAAYTNLGYMFAEGKGVPKNSTEAFNWFRKAAKMGEDNAQYNIGVLYANGEGVPANDLESIRWYRKAADQGNVGAQNNLGAAYQYGDGVPEDLTEAVKWYSKAAEQGYALAQNNLGYLYANGKGVIEDDVEAVMWYRRAAEQGNAGAQNNLGIAYQYGRGIPKDDSEAVKWFRLSAEQGDPDGLYNLGIVYANGEGVPEDKAEAVIWYRKAAEQGNAMAQNSLGVAYQYGIGVSKDNKEAVKWYRRAAEKGSAMSQNNLGTMYAYGKGVSEDDVEALKWYRKAAEKGHARAQNSLGMAYHYGDGVPKDDAEAVIWYRKAANQGNAMALNSLGVAYQNGEGVSEDAAEAVKWFRKAAKLGYALAQNRLGLAYLNGEGVSKDAAEAVKWFRKAAEQDFVSAQYNVGVLLAYGEGAPEDKAEAAKWFRLSAEQGNPKAQNDLGSAYLNGEGVSKDATEAVKWYRMAAEQGYAMAQYNLGVLYAEGEGVSKDDVEAIRLYRLAANQGDAMAQNNLGKAYQHGIGVPENLTASANWYRKAAEQGYALAQRNLGFAYEYGDGVPKDEAEAVKWYRLSAMQGNELGQHSLGLMYAEGKGVPKDAAEAVKWYRLAAVQGNNIAQDDLGTAYKNGIGVPEDAEEALKWYGKAADHGYAPAIFNLGEMYLEGSGVAKNVEAGLKVMRRIIGSDDDGLYKTKLASILVELDRYDEALPLFRKAANQGDAYSQSTFGKFLISRSNSSEEVKEGVKWLEAAAEQGYGSSAFYLGEMYVNGNGVSKDVEVGLKLMRRTMENDDDSYYMTRLASILVELGRHDEALPLFRQAANQGSAHSQSIFGKHLTSANRSSEEVREGIKWLEAAAEQGDDEALFSLGEMYVEGRGLPKDVDAGLELMRRAVEKDFSVYKKTELASTLSKLKMYDEAIPMYREVANQGNAYGQTIFGELLTTLKRSPEEVKEGIAWLVSASESGSSFAQSTLGFIYQSGQAVPQDYKLAFKWMKMAADQGDPYAQNTLASYYLNGFGTTKNPTTALDWYQKSADLGNAYSFAMVGQAYQFGNGVEKNLLRAKENYEKGAEGNDLFSTAILAALNMSGGIPDADYRVVDTLINKFLEYADSIEKEEESKYTVLLAPAYIQFGQLSSTLGRYPRGELFFKKAIDIRMKFPGEQSKEYVDALSGYASLLQQSGRYEQAELLWNKSLQILKELNGDHKQKIAFINLDIALLKEATGKLTEAENILRKNLKTIVATMGKKESLVFEGLITGGIARILSTRGKYIEAKKQFEYALELLNKTDLFPANEPLFFQIQGDYAQLLTRMGRNKKAELIFREVLKNVENIGIQDHPLVIAAVVDFTRVLQANGKHAEAFQRIDQFAETYSKRLAKQSRETLSELSAERKIIRKSLIGQIGVLLDPSVKTDISEHQKRLNTSFKLMQLLRTVSAADAVNKMGLRFARGNDDFAKIVRERQDLLRQWQGLDSSVVSSLGRASDKNVTIRTDHYQSALNQLEVEIKDIDQHLLDTYPQYFELASAQSANILQTQRLIADDEALVTYLVGDEESFLWVLRNDRAEFHKIELTWIELEKAVKRLRLGLDSTGLTDLKQVSPFNTTTAYELYKKLLAPAEPFLDGVRHVMVVPDGALQSLPLGVLVTEKPKNFKIKKLKNGVIDFSDYLQVPWLAKKYALSTLPSVSSLKALRVFAKKEHSTEPFTGFGDPVLDGKEGSQRGIELASLFSRGTVVDVAQLNSLGRLPDTADELKAIAESLNADKGSVYLGSQATERRVKEMDLSNIGVLAFATHGLVAGQLKGVSEPGLVLTPPQQSNDRDDGFLTASEVAQLKLNADWVILSACNTASSDGTSGAEGLSGLAKAFFYAGSRALLVSHWPVLTDAAKALTTKMLKEAKDKTISRAEALKRSMISLINTPDSPHYAHPMFWAPFTIVGEGG
jgi:TPR repeat protein/CHAT domain-containing protein